MIRVLVTSIAMIPLLLPALEREVVTTSNALIRIMAANLPGDSQRYEAPAERILQGLKPDIVAIQEFRTGNSTPQEIRAFVDTNFGPSFSYFRESGYSIPNGVISRFPMRASGSWYDTNVTDRGFAWAEIDLPGSADLYVVSVHLKASAGDASVRARQAAMLKSLISSNLPANAWVVVAGDCNFQSRGESGLATFTTFLRDSPIPADELGDADTNLPRSRPYDYVLPSFSFQTNYAPLLIGSLTFPNGLVFDSRNFSQLSAVAPIQQADSGFGQHMAVLKAFSIPFLVTNRVIVPEPMLSLSRANALTWNSAPGVEYAVEAGSDLITWNTVAVVRASSAIAATNMAATNAMQFYRLSY